MEFKSFPEQLLFATLRVETRDKDRITIGTGFLLRADLGDNQALLLLVSNRHVLADRRNLVLNFHRRKGSTNEPALGEILQYSAGEYSGVYFEHPNPRLDLACLNITQVFSELSERIYWRHLDRSIFSSFSEEELDIGQRVTFIGYPDDRYDVVHNLPVLRSGFIASHPKVNFNGVQQFLIDAQVFPGSSGSPVFLNLHEARLPQGQIVMGPGPTYLLLGVVSATMVRHSRIEVLPTSVSLGTQEVIGLGLVSKATAVAELMDFVVERYRQGNR